MSESNRMQRWRQRQREAGKEPLTIWLKAAEKLYLEDMALIRHCSPSELVQQALAHWRGESPPVTATVTDTEQLRALVQEELAKPHSVTATVTDTVTATLQQALPGLVRTLLSAQQAGSVSVTVTDTVTDTSPSPSVDRIPEPVPKHVADTVSATVTDTVVLPMTYPATVAIADTVVLPMTAPVTDPATDTTTSPTTKRKTPPRQRTVTDTISDTVTVTDPALEPFDTAKYVLGKLCPRGHAWGSTGQSLLRRTNRHCGACDREKFRERQQAKRQEVSA